MIMSKMILKNTGLVIGDQVGETGSLFYNFPSMEILSNGEWLVASREIRNLDDPKGKIRVRRSEDQGKNWKDSPSPTCHDERDYPENGFLLCHITELAPDELFSIYMMIFTNESEPLFHKTTDGMQKTKVRITKSFDNGKTWSKPKDIEYETKDLLVTGKPIVFADGSIGIPCEMHDEWTQGYQEPLAAKFLKSYDRGYTIAKGITAACDPSILYGDARPAFNGKELTLFFWTYDVAQNKDLPIHRVQSLDFGETWSKVEPIHLAMQITSPLYVNNHLMVCICQDRFSENPGIKAIFSYDGGMEWDWASEITIFGTKSKPDGNNPFKQFNQFKFGCSSVRRISEKEFAVIFWHDNTATTSISVAIVEITE
jgi:hypothetical protein